MTIVTSPPYVFTNGTVADAGQVDADLNQIVAQVNASAAASGVNNDITALHGLISTPQTIGAATTVVSYNGPITLTTTGSASYVITLSAPGSGGLQSPQRIFNNSGVTQTVSSASTFLQGGLSSGTSFTLLDQDTVLLDWDGTHWLVAYVVSGFQKALVDGIDIFSVEARARGTSQTITSQAYGIGGARFVNIAAGASQQLATYTGGPGYISEIFMVCNNNDDYSTIQIVTDGATVYSGALSTFCAASDQATQSGFYSDFFAASNGNATGGGTNTWGGTKSGNTSYLVRIPIPFYASFTITYTNRTALQQSVPWSVRYQSGVPNSWPRTRKLLAPFTFVSGVGAYAWTDLINATGLKRGRLFGFHLLVDGSGGGLVPNSAYKEGPIEIYVDGGVSPIYRSTGLEDGLFRVQNYWEGVPLTASQTQPNRNYNTSRAEGLTINQIGTTAGYRLFLNDPITFENAIHVRFQNGQYNPGNTPPDGVQITSGGSIVAGVVWAMTE